MNITKRILALALVAVMLLGILPTAYAETSDVDTIKFSLTARASATITGDSISSVKSGSNIYVFVDYEGNAKKQGSSAGIFLEYNVDLFEYQSTKNYLKTNLAETTADNGVVKHAFGNTDGFLVQTGTDEDGEPVYTESEAGTICYFKFKVKSDVLAADLNGSFKLTQDTNVLDKREWKMAVDLGSALTVNVIVPNSIVISGPDEVAVETTGSTANYTATCYDSNGDVANQIVTWGVTGSDSLSINKSGTLSVGKYVKAGSYTITASSTVNGVTSEGTKTIKITKDASVPTSWTADLSCGKETVKAGAAWSGSDKSSTDASAYSLAYSTNARTFTLNAEIWDQYGVAMNVTPTIKMVTVGEGGTAPVYTDSSITLPAQETLYVVSVDVTGGWNFIFRFNVEKAPSVPTKVVVDPSTANLEIPLGDTPTTQVFTAKVLDQYGEEMDLAQDSGWQYWQGLESLRGVTWNEKYGEVTVKVTKEAQVTNSSLELRIDYKRSDEPDDYIVGAASVNLVKLAFTNTLTVKDSPVYGDIVADILGLLENQQLSDAFTAKLGGDTISGGTYTLQTKMYGVDGWQDTSLDAYLPTGTFSLRVLYTNTEKGYENVVAWQTAENAVVVAPKTVTVTIGNIPDQTYTGTDIKPEVTVSCDGLVGNDQFSTSDYTVSYENNQNVGTATVKVESKSGSWYQFATATKDFEIVAGKITAPTAVSNLVYNGQEQTGVAEDTGYTVTGGTGTNATSYTATATLADAENYTWSDGTTTDKQIPWSIAQFDIKDAEVTLSWDSKPYSGSEQKPTATAVTVKLDGETPVPLNPDQDYELDFGGVSPVDAASYTVQIKGTGNYTGEVTKTFTINKAEQTELTVGTTSMEYGQSLNLCIAGGSGTGAVTCVITNGDCATVTEEQFAGEWSIKATGVGKVTVKVTKAGDQNYQEKTTTQEITINRATWLPSQQNVSLVYSDTAEHTFTAADIAALLGGEQASSATTATITGVTTTNTDGILSGEAQKDASGTKVTYKLCAGLDKDKDKGKTATISVSYDSNFYQSNHVDLVITIVDKNPATVTFSADDSVTYNGQAQKPDAPTVTLSSGTADLSKLTYTVTKGGSQVTDGINGMVDAGTYTIVATYEDESNYGQSAPFIFTIAPASIAGKLDQITGTYTYDGTAKTPELTFSDTYVTSNDYTVAYQRNDTATDDLTSAGTVTVVVTGKNNYTGTDSKSFTIAQASLSGANITLTGTDDLTYNGEEQKPTAVKVEVSGKELVNTDYTVNYSDDVINAGTVTVTITAKDDGNYTGTKTTSYEIKSASLSDLVKEIEGTFTYDGTQKRPEVSFTDAKVTNADYEVSYGENINAGNNAGSVKVTGKGNYTGEVTKTFTINKAAAPTGLKDVEKSYKYSLTGQQTAQVSGVPNNAGTVGYEVTDDFTGNAYVSDVSVSESGLVSFNLKGQDTYNKDAFVTIPVRVTMQNYATQIVKVNISFTDRDAQQALVVNGITASTGKVALSMKCGETLALNVTGGSGSGEVTVTIESGTNYCLYIGTQKTVKAEAVGTVTLKVRKAGDTDYQDAEAMIVITIGKGTPAITGNVETETEAGKLVVKADKDAETFGEVLTADDFDVDGVLTWTGKNSDGEDVEINGNTKLEDVNLDTVNWTFAPESENYEPVTGGISQEKSSNAWWIIGGLGAIGGSSASPLDDFTDLDADAWYAEAVEYCLDEGLMSGTGNGKFSPNGGMTRAMVWTVLGRMSGETLNGTGANWYLDAQKWAVRTGVSDGTDPNGQITREELVTMLWRFAGSPKADVSALRWYGDSATISDWAREAMAWAVNASVVEGSNWNLTPNAVATRCQVAAIFMRYHKFG